MPVRPFAAGAVMSVRPALGGIYGGIGAENSQFSVPESG